MSYEASFFVFIVKKCKIYDKLQLKYFALLLMILILRDKTMNDTLTQFLIDDNKHYPYLILNLFGEKFGHY